VRIDGTLWVCWRSSRDLKQPEDAAECVAVMPMDDFIDAQAEEGKTTKLLWYHEWAEQVAKETRSVYDFRGLKLVCTQEGAIGYFVCLGEKRKFHSPLPVSEPAPVADDEAADAYFDPNEVPDATDEAIEQTYSLATYDRDALPAVVVEFAELLHERLIHALTEVDWDAMQPYLADLEDLDDDIPAFWEQTMTALAKRIVAQDAFPAVGITARSHALLRKMADRRAMTQEDYLEMLIAQRAEQLGIESEETGV
jgi:hypothetical protein